MSRYTNPSGYVKYDNENEYKKYLEMKFFSYFFDKPWEVTIGKTKEVPIRKDTNRSIIDYFGYKNNIPTYVEVKNDRIRQRHLLQIMRYYCDCNEVQIDFKLYVICSNKIRPHREKILKKLGINILSIKDIKELNSDEVVYWM